MAHAGIIDIDKLNRALDEIQTATYNAEPIIRCKDCKYWTQNPFGGKVGFCNKHKDIAIACEETDFCSWAERKEHETD